MSTRWILSCCIILVFVGDSHGFGLGQLPLARFASPSSSATRRRPTSAFTPLKCVFVPERTDTEADSFVNANESPLPGGLFDHRIPGVHDIISDEPLEEKRAAFDLDGAVPIDLSTLMHR